MFTQPRKHTSLSLTFNVNIKACTSSMKRNNTFFETVESTQSVEGSLACLVGYYTAPPPNLNKNLEKPYM